MIDVATCTSKKNGKLDLLLFSDVLDMQKILSIALYYSMVINFDITVQSSYN